MNFRERADTLRTDLLAAITPILEEFQKDTGVLPTIQTFALDVSTFSTPHRFLTSDIRLEVRL
jgi:hypothetical protein